MELDGKTFKVMCDNGKCYSITLPAPADVKSAKAYARIWLRAAGSDDRIVKVWERTDEIV